VIFLYNQEAGAKDIVLKDESYRHLFKVRRERKGSEICLRNLADNKLYTYKIISVSKKDATILLLSSKEDDKKDESNLHIIWAIVDIKNIEKTLPLLNELGVAKVTLFYADRSQRSFKVNLDRVKKILINSCEQCGRSTLLEVRVADSLASVLREERDIVVIDFSEKKLRFEDECNTYLVGPEGGFSSREKKLLGSYKTLGFDTSLVLRSETAVVAIASKALLV